MWSGWVCEIATNLMSVGLDAELIELAREGLRPTPVRCLRIGRGLPVGHRGDGVGNPGVPEQPALRVVDQVAVVDEIHRLADIDARRPAGNVAGDTFAAIENVEFVDARFGLRRGRRSEIDSAANAATKIADRFITNPRSAERMQS